MFICEQGQQSYKKTHVVRSYILYSPIFPSSGSATSKNENLENMASIRLIYGGIANIILNMFYNPKIFLKSDDQVLYYSLKIYFLDFFQLKYYLIQEL